MTNNREWLKYSKAQGIQFRYHAERKVGPRSPDRYWRLFYRFEGKLHAEPLGWESEGWSEEEVVKVAAVLASNRKKQLPPLTFAALRAQNAQRMASRKRREEEAARQSLRESVTFEQLWPDYIAAREHTVHHPRTWSGEKSRWKKWIQPRFGHCRLADVGAEDAVSFLQEAHTHLAVQSVRHLSHLLSQLWNFARAQGLVNGVNPFYHPDVRKAAPPSDARRTRFLTAQEAKILLDKIRETSPVLWAKCMVLLYTGLRPIEVNALLWADVDRNNRTVRVRREVVTNKGRTRVVPYPEVLDAVFIQCLPRPYNANALVFPPRTGKRGVLHSDGLSNTFDRAVAALGWNEGVPPHDRIMPYTLRHTYASWLAQKGVPLYTIAKLLGHSTQSVTDRYAHLCPDTFRAAVGLLG